MPEQRSNDQPLMKAISLLVNLLILLLIVIAGLTIALFHYVPLQKTTEHALISAPVVALGAIHEEKKTQLFWQAPDESTMLNNRDKEKIQYGKELIMHTSLYFGPKGKVNTFTNGMNCQNCHLDAGAKIFGNNYSAVASTYPKYRARSGSKEDIGKRVNDCFERSLNGKALDENSKEMQSIIAYIKWLGKDVEAGNKPEGSGLKEITFLNRKADADAGKLVYEQKCQSCHQANGEGVMNENKTEYVYPPLWGEHSYNTGAGLYRISNFAKFVKYNMPLGVSHDNTVLTDEEAWDVAAFINSRNRPKKDIRKDWPLTSEKPFDHPFGPYTDGFSEDQHKYGPYPPIIEQISASKKKK